MNKTDQLHNRIKLEDLTDGKPHRVRWQNKNLLLCRVRDQVYAVDEKCPHEDISLSLGVMCEHRLRCPLHGSEFDVRTGSVLNEPADTDLNTYPVTIKDGWVYLGSM
jgi:nitrite reductase/ring-hydroxylating ferredoxin subunit